jgi:hypothetical protein
LLPKGTFDGVPVKLADATVERVELPRLGFEEGNGVSPVLFTFIPHPSHELLQFPSFLGQSPKPP